MDLPAIRDWVLTVALIALALWLVLTTLALTVLGWKLLRGLRRARRLHDDHLPDMLETGAERLGQLNDRLSAGGLLALTLAAGRLVQRRRAARRPRRLRRLRAALAAVRP